MDETSASGLELPEKYFYGYEHLEEINLVYIKKEAVDNPKTIDFLTRCFSECVSLVDINLYNLTVGNLSEYVFENCRNFTNANGNFSNLPVYPRGAFFGCNRLHITLNGTTEIGNYAFVACNELGNLVIPNTVTAVGSEAFAYSVGPTLNVDFTAAEIAAKNVEEGDWYHWNMDFFGTINYKA